MLCRPSAGLCSFEAVWLRAHCGDTCPYDQEACSPWSAPAPLQATGGGSSGGGGWQQWQHRIQQQRLQWAAALAAVLAGRSRAEVKSS
jgi:hypothetical protein